VIAGPLALGLGLAGVSALSTAVAHALLKFGDDKLAVQTWVRLTELALFGPLALWLGPPPATLSPWLLATALILAVYQVVLIGSYQLNDFAVGFPIARGTAPLLTALGGALWLGDRLGPGQWAGVALIVAAIVLLAVTRRVRGLGLATAIGAGSLTCLYSLLGAGGMRAAPGPLMFLAWFYVADSVSMPLLFALVRPRAQWWPNMAATARIGIGAGLGAVISFTPALVAFRYAPAGAVAAIRETSVVGAMIASHRWLGEAPGWRHWLAALGVTFGAILLVFNSP
jgi:drug/metabolite transporter (DMT)-like permease